MPVSKTRKKNKKPTPEKKRRQGVKARQVRRNINELQNMISVLDEWPSEHIDYTKFKKEKHG